MFPVLEKGLHQSGYPPASQSIPVRPGMRSHSDGMWPSSPGSSCRDRLRGRSTVSEVLLW
ncbi:hypothetical protein Ga0080559_TMP3028 [Salipiger profundus]|uniref:Uncharacterized protein n=1 Tax=Salipiger profundus TaxID=1229727 RepID=A0A1U7D6N4_9RHOB|nr:hypothetical protein Ga0080559_TMP3028 [Salipiger profundus]